MVKQENNFKIKTNRHTIKGFLKQLKPSLSLKITYTKYTNITRNKAQKIIQTLIKPNLNLLGVKREQLSAIHNKKNLSN